MIEEATQLPLTADEARGAIDALLAENGITMVAAFVPQSLSRNSQEKTHTLNWRVTFSRAVASRLSSTFESFALDYSQGIGHVPGGFREPRTLWEESAFGKPWETGHYNPRPQQSSFASRKLPPPTAADILYCIVLDGSSVQESFEDWCSSFGYDPDSRKAEGIYRECQKQQRDALRVLGRDVLSKAETILQDY